MKKFLVPAVLAVALVVPAQAVAKKPKHYVGGVSPSGSIGFKVVQKKHSKKKSVAGFNFSAIPVTCDDGAHTAHGFVSFPVKLSGGSFAIHGSNSATGATLDVEGTLSAGTLHISGPVALDGGGTGSGCDSGVLSWTAQRG